MKDSLAKRKSLFKPGTETFKPRINTLKKYFIIMYVYT